MLMPLTVFQPILLPHLNCYLLLLAASYCSDLKKSLMPIYIMWLPPIYINNTEIHYFILLCIQIDVSKWIIGQAKVRFKFISNVHRFFLLNFLLNL